MRGQAERTDDSHWWLVFSIPARVRKQDNVPTFVGSVAIAVRVGESVQLIGCSSPPFLVIKRIFGFAKTRYRGLDKNANRLFVACALTNLYLMRRRLLRAT